MALLHQLIAARQLTQRDAGAAADAARAALARPDLFAGFNRVYFPLSSEDGEGRQLESSQKVQATVVETLRGLRAPWVHLVDVLGTLERGNQEARADLTVSGMADPLIPAAPVGLLLALKRLGLEFRRIIDASPVLDPSMNFEWDSTLGLYRAEPVRIERTGKTHRALEIIKPTEHQPGQGTVISMDEVIGHYVRTAFSGALAPTDKSALLERATLFLRAVDAALGQANSRKVEPFHYGDAVLGFLLDIP